MYYRISFLATRVSVTFRQNGRPSAHGLSDLPLHSERAAYIRVDSFLDAINFGSDQRVDQQLFKIEASVYMYERVVLFLYKLRY